MATSFRPQGSDGPMYSPARDVAHMGVRMIGRTLDDLAADRTGWLGKNLTDPPLRLAASEDMQDRVAEAMARFLNLVNQEDVADLEEAWDDSGLAACCREIPGVVVPIFALLGQRFLMAVFNGLRDVTRLMDPKYSEDADAFFERVEVALAYRALPRWKKLLYRFLPAKVRHERVMAWWRFRAFPRISP